MSIACISSLAAKSTIGRLKNIATSGESAYTPPLLFFIPLITKAITCSNVSSREKPRT